MENLNFTLLIIIITVVTSYSAWTNPIMASKWVMNPYLTKRNKEYYRFLSSGFIHATDLPFGYMHLGFNMWALYVFGSVIEEGFISLFDKPLGIILYLAMYLLGIIISSVPSYLRHKDNPAYNALGASGGVSSVIFSYILFLPTAGIGFLFLPVYIPGFIMGIAYLIYSYAMARKGAGRIGHDAHFIGAAFGVLFTAVVYPDVFEYHFINGPFGLANWDFAIIQF